MTFLTSIKKILTCISRIFYCWPGLHYITFIGAYSDSNPFQYEKFHRVEWGEVETNVFVHEGGNLIFSPQTSCRGVRIVVMGTIGVRDFNVAAGCRLQLGPTGSSKVLSTTDNANSTHDSSSATGVYKFVSLTVGDQGEVSALPGAKDLENNLTIVAFDTLRVFGGGSVHAVSLNLKAHKLIVDDLGVITGDSNSISCHGDPHTTTTSDNVLLTGRDKNIKFAEMKSVDSGLKVQSVRKMELNLFLLIAH